MGEYRPHPPGSCNLPRQHASGAMRSLPTLNALKTLDAFVRTGRIDTAAETLGVTEWAVTQALEKLANDLGVPLVETRRTLPKYTAAALMMSEAYQKATLILEEAVGRIPARPLRKQLVWIAPKLEMSSFGGRIRSACDIDPDNSIEFSSAAMPLDWEIAIGFEPVRQPRVHKSVLTALRMAILSRSPDLSRNSLESAPDLLADAELPWEKWLADQELEMLIPRVKPVSKFSELAEALGASNVPAIALRALYHQELEAGTIHEIWPTYKSSHTVNLYLSRSVRNSFSKTSTSILRRIKSAAIVANIT